MSKYYVSFLKFSNGNAKGGKINFTFQTYCLLIFKNYLKFCVLRIMKPESEHTALGNCVTSIRVTSIPNPQSYSHHDCDQSILGRNLRLRESMMQCIMRLAHLSCFKY